MPLAVEAMKAGAVDFIEKPFDDDVMLAAVRAALTRGVAAGKRDAERADIEERIKRLSPRELDVLEMLAEGLSNKMIAHRLSISDHTAKFHVNSILAKLDAGTRTEAVTRGIRLGLIKL